MTTSCIGAGSGSGLPEASRRATRGRSFVVVPRASLPSGLRPLAALVVVPFLAACAHSATRASASHDELTAWETRLAAAPECRGRIAPSAAHSRAEDSSGDASMVVRLVAFGSHELLDFAHLKVEELDRAQR